MDVASLVQSLLPSALHTLSQLVPAVPYVVLACAVYLVGNDVLDALLVRKQNKSASLNDFTRALAADVANQTALTLGTTAAVTALAAGGDFRAAFVAALVTVASANMATFEASTLTKLRTLLA